jgi:cell division transport system permease protein
MSAAAKLSYFLRAAFGSLARSPFIHVVAVSALALALTGYGIARVTVGQLEALRATLGEALEFTVYLTDDAAPKDVDELERALVVRTGGTAHRVSSTEAMQRLARELGDAARGLEFLNDSPLPASLEISLPAEHRDPQALRQLAEKTRSLAFVKDVDYGDEVLERLSAITNGLRFAGLVVFTLVFLTTITVVAATLQLAIFARRDEIEIQKLVGATNRFVRMPFLMEGGLQGVLAGGLAVTIVFLLVRFLESEQSQVVAFSRLEGRIVVDWAKLGLEQVAAGAFLGLCGSFIAVRRFMRV